jgi:hypothetical protein
LLSSVQVQTFDPALVFAMRPLTLAAVRLLLVDALAAEDVSLAAGQVVVVLGLDLDLPTEDF